MDIETEKRRLEELIKEVNSLSTTNKVELHQQKVLEQHLSIIGGNGRLCVEPVSNGYDIGLSGKCLENKMYRFMCDLCQKECTGYKQTNQRIGKKDLPFWRVESFSLVEQAVYHYAGVEYEFLPSEEIVNPEQYPEGLSKTISVNVYERNVKARKECLKEHGYKCIVCDFDFEKTYGAIGKSYIHVHHIVPLSEIKQEYDIDPKRDLVPVCPNCHSMLHRSKEVLSIEKLKELLGRESANSLKQ